MGLLMSALTLPTPGQLPRELTEGCLSVLEPIYSLTPKAEQPAAEALDKGG